MQHTAAHHIAMPTLQHTTTHHTATDRVITRDLVNTQHRAANLSPHTSRDYFDLDLFLIRLH